MANSGSHREKEKENDLPPELWCLVFEKLPLKSVIRCRVVKKVWYNILSNHSFAVQYQAYCQRHRIKRIVIGDRMCQELSDHLYTDAHDDHLQLSLSLFRPTSEDLYRQVSSCDGLVLLLNETWSMDGKLHQRFVLWNPSVNIIRNLPPSTLDSKDLTFISGVGTDRRHNVKVMRIGFSKLSCVVSDILDLEEWVWRTINVWVPPYQFDTKYPPHCLEGSLHWIGYSETVVMDSGLCQRALITFDMSEEAFKELQVPQLKFPRRGGGDLAEEATLLLFDDKLAMAQVTLHRAGHEAACMDQLLCVWVMSSYGAEASWKLIVKLDMTDVNLGRPFYASRNGDLIVWGDGEVSFCDFENKVIGQLSIYEFKPQFFVYPYLESLLLLN